MWSRAAVTIGVGLLVVSCAPEEPAFNPDIPTAVGTQLDQPPQAEPIPIGPGPTHPRAETRSTGPAGAQPAALSLERITSGFDKPVSVAAAPGTDLLYVTEQTGRVRIVGPSGATRPLPFLDVSDKITTEWTEQGLIGLVFHPDYQSNRRLFVAYVDTIGRLKLVEYQAVSEGIVDPRTQRVVLDIFHPSTNHYGGSLVFGPDGYLYMGIGDGGGIGDPFENGQNPYSLQGTVIRIDVDAAEPYAAPPDNPFVPGGGAVEVFVFGLRNPWRLAIDDGLLYIADVGQDWWEEVNVVELDQPGGNFGWPIREGPDCYEADQCDDSGTVDAVVDVFHRGACAIVGGPVYRGSALPGLRGQFFYGDFCIGWVRSAALHDAATRNGPVTTRWFDALPDGEQLTSFGLDHRGEILLLTLQGSLYRITEGDPG